MAKKRQAKKTAKKLQAELQESAHKIWLAGLGALSAAGEEGNRFFHQLVEKGEDVESRGKKRFDEARDEVQTGAKKARERVESSVDEMWEKMDERLAEAMQRFGVPTRDEIQSLTRRVEELNTKIDHLRNGGSAPERAVYRVVTHEDGWKVEAEGSDEPASVHSTKGEAVDAGRDLAQSKAPSQLVIHKKDGKLQTEYTYEAN